MKKNIKKVYLKDIEFPFDQIRKSQEVVNDLIKFSHEKNIDGINTVTNNIFKHLTYEVDTWSKLFDTLIDILKVFLSVTGSLYIASYSFLEIIPSRTLLVEFFIYESVFLAFAVITKFISLMILLRSHKQIKEIHRSSMSEYVKNHHKIIEEQLKLESKINEAIHLYLSKLT